ncbi:MAG TPA: hypothetical protein VEI97_09270, partial [bacterium]|nr:hypothetical protein [bacterium]
WSPVSLAYRAGTSGPGEVSPEGAGEALRSFMLGSLIKAGNTQEDQLDKLWSAYGKASEANQAAQYQELRSPLADTYAEAIEPLKPKDAISYLSTEWARILQAPMPYKDKQKALSILGEGLRRAAQSNRKLIPVLRQYDLARLPSIDPQGSLAPHLAEELKKLSR